MTRSNRNWATRYFRPVNGKHFWGKRHHQWHSHVLNRSQQKRENKKKAALGDSLLNETRLVYCLMTLITFCSEELFS